MSIVSKVGFIHKYVLDFLSAYVGFTYLLYDYFVIVEINIQIIFRLNIRV